jgi:hypothetical protein
MRPIALRGHGPLLQDCVYEAAMRPIALRGRGPLLQLAVALDL